MMLRLIFLILLMLFFIIFLLISIAFYTLAERKIIASIQRRKGPSLVGFRGFLQPFADGLKLILKEIIIPSRAKFLLFTLAPLLTFILSFLA